MPLMDPPALDRRGSGSARDRERMERERVRARIRAGAPRQTPLVVPPPDAKDDTPLLKGKDLPPPSVKKSKPPKGTALGPTLAATSSARDTRTPFSDAGASTDITSSEAEPDPEVDLDANELRGRSRTPPHPPRSPGQEEQKPSCGSTALAGRRDPSTGRLAPTDLPPAALAGGTTLVSKWTNRPSRSWMRKGESPGGARSWSFSPRAASVHSTSETEGEDAPAAPPPSHSSHDPATSVPPISGGARWTSPGPASNASTTSASIGAAYDSPASEFCESGSEWDAAPA